MINDLDQKKKNVMMHESIVDRVAVKMTMTMLMQMQRIMLQTQLQL